MNDITKRFLSGILHINYSRLPINICSKARECFLDYLGVLIGGLHFLKIQNPQSISIIPNSALLKGFAAHILELDDGHRAGAVHVGATVFSALLSLPKDMIINSADFIRGIVVGYEATIRLACAIQPGNKLRGYHATGTCGTVGAALGIAAALHYTEEEMNTTIAAAVTSAAGLLEMQENDSDLKPYNVGRAAMDAVMASYIGRSGLKGPKDALGGKRGFLSVMTDVSHPEYLTDFSGDNICIEQIYQKVYAACRHAHPAIEAVLALRNSVDVADIKKITVRTYKLAVVGHDHQDVCSSISSAKMSIPFSVAVALVRGEAGLNAFTRETVADERIIVLAKRVQVIEDENLTALSRIKRASIVEIKTSQKVYTNQVNYPRGEPENPLSQQELEVKFRSLSKYGGLSEAECDEVIYEIWKENLDLERIKNIVFK